MRKAPLLALALSLCAGTAAAQQGKPLREQLVGTWNFVIAEINERLPAGEASGPAAGTP